MRHYKYWTFEELVEYLFQDDIHPGQYGMLKKWCNEKCKEAYNLGLNTDLSEWPDGEFDGNFIINFKL